MSVKDTLKKKVAPIAVAAATLLTPVATQGAEKPEAEQNPQKMEQIQEKKLTRNEQIDELIGKKKVPEAEVKIMRQAAQDLDQTEAFFEKMSKLLKEQGIDEKDLEKYENVHYHVLKNGNLVVMLNDYSKKNVPAERAHLAFEFDSSGKLLRKGRTCNAATEEEFDQHGAIIHAVVEEIQKHDQGKDYVVGGDPKNISCRDERGALLFRIYDDANERSVLYQDMVVQGERSDKWIDFDDKGVYSHYPVFTDKGIDTKTAKVGRIEFEDLKQPKEKNLLQSAVQNKVLGR